MNLFDLRTVVLTGFFLTAVCTLVLFLLWRDNRRRFRGIGYWVTDLSFVTAAQLLLGLRGILPDWLSIGGANPFALIGAYFGLLGFSRFTRTPVHRPFNTAVIVLLIAFNTYAVFVQPSLETRNLVIAAGLVVLCGQSAWVLLTPADRSLRNVGRSLGVVFVLFVGVNLLRLVFITLPAGASNDFYRMGSFQTGVMVTYQILILLMTYGMVMMVNRRLLRNLASQEEKFSKAFHSSPYAILLTRFSDGRVIDVNAGFEVITGYRASEVLGKTTPELGLWAESGTRETIVRQLTEQGKLLNEEVSLRRKNGEELPGLLSADTFEMAGEQVILSSINDISRRKALEEERERLLSELTEAMANMKTMSGLIPICASCKKIRDDKGFWNQLEKYLTEHSEATFSHGICPECLKRDFPEVYKKRHTD